MSALESYNLGDFLRIREEDENRRRVDSLAGLTLSDIILSEKRVAAAQTRLNRTLLDVIRVPERSSSGVNIQQNQNQLEKEKKTWRAIKDRLRLKRNGAVLTTDNRFHRHSNGTDLNRATGESTSAGAGHAAVHRDADGSFSFSRRGTTMRLGDHILLDPAEPARLGSSRRLSAALNDERELSEREAAAAQEALREESPPPPAEEEQPVRMSLMELLEETTERQMEGRYDDGMADEEEGSEAPPTAAAEQKCCVCMIRHKGAAFIPCGHTFCRMCSRELFVQRGNCPLCNTEISEILDIF